LKITKEQIEKFFEQKIIALIGVSRNPKDITRGLYRDLKRHGYQVYAINPNTNKIDDDTCYPDIENITDKIDSVIIFTPTPILLNIVESVFKKDIKNIWLYNGDNKSKSITDVAESLKGRGVNVILGYCPYMFLSDVQFFHRLHGFFAKLSGGYYSK
jgi:uncharacterized protein